VVVASVEVPVTARVPLEVKELEKTPVVPVIAPKVATVE
jgi:hypothetical protein